MIQLIDISNGSISLEYDFEDQESVRKAISERDPNFVIINRPSHAVIEVGGTKLIADSDVGGLCLISSDERGNAILREIFKQLIGR